MDFEAKKGLSRKQIREIARIVRKLLKIRTIKFPVLEVLEKLTCLYPDNLYYVIEADDDFRNNVMAYLEIESEYSYCIHIRESVYNGAVKGRKDCLGFICHEISHFILIFILDNGPKISLNEFKMACERALKQDKIPPYLSTEWQAMALCGELMIPYEECKDKTFRQISFITKSSKKQIEFFLNKVVKNDDKRKKTHF